MACLSTVERGWGGVTDLRKVHRRFPLTLHLTNQESSGAFAGFEGSAVDLLGTFLHVKCFLP